MKIHSKSVENFGNDEEIDLCRLTKVEVTKACLLIARQKKGSIGI